MYLKGIKGIIKIFKGRYKNLPITIITLLLIAFLNAILIIISLKSNVKISGINLLKKGNELDLILNIGINIVNLIIPVLNFLWLYLIKFSFYIGHILIICVIGFIEKMIENGIYKKFEEMKFIDSYQNIPKILNFNIDRNKVIITIKSAFTKNEIISYDEKFEHFFDKVMYKINCLGKQKTEIILLTKEEFNKLNKKKTINFKNHDLQFEERLKGSFDYLGLHISNIKVKENYLFKNVYFNSNEKWSYLKNMEVEITHRLQQIITIESSDENIFDYKITLRKNKVLSYKDILKKVSNEMDKMTIPFILGSTTNGEIKIVDYKDKFHTIIGGSTGCGKTNYIHSMLTSLLYANKNLSYVILDIKKDMNMYKNIDNVVYADNPQTIKIILQNLIEEMEERNKIFGEMDFTKGIEKYNKTSKEAMPYILVVIDEVADLLMSYDTKEGEDVQKLIQRLVQRARSAGFRILLTTQKPTVKVINGIIKGNCNNRLGFMVDNAIDSRIILDDSRASTITSQGEFYFKSNNRFTLFKGVYISDKEHEEILNHVKKNFKIA